MTSSGVSVCVCARYRCNLTGEKSLKATLALRVSFLHFQLSISSLLLDALLCSPSGENGGFMITVGCSCMLSHLAVSSTLSPLPNFNLDSFTRHRGTHGRYGRTNIPSEFCSCWGCWELDVPFSAQAYVRLVLTISIFILQLWSGHFMKDTHCLPHYHPQSSI